MITESWVMVISMSLGCSPQHLEPFDRTDKLAVYTTRCQDQREIRVPDFGALSGECARRLLEVVMDPMWHGGKTSGIGLRKFNRAYNVCVIDADSEASR